MGKISVNTDTMESLADLLERQAEMLENIGETKQKYYMKEVASGVYFF